MSVLLALFLFLSGDLMMVRSFLCHGLMNQNLQIYGSSVRRGWLLSRFQSRIAYIHFSSPRIF